MERRLYSDEEDGGSVKFRGLRLVSCPPTVSGPHEASTVTEHPPCLQTHVLLLLSTSSVFPP